MSLGILAFDQLFPPVANAVLGPWGGYTNGTIPLSALTAVNYPGVVPYGFPGSLPAVYMKPDAAAGLTAMLSKYHSDTGSYLRVNEGYRTYAGQQYWWDYWGHNSAKAAVPGTSNHGWGLAFDLESPTYAQVSWVAVHGRDFGYTGIQSEDWHFDFSGTFAYNPAPPPQTSNGEELFIMSAPNRGIALVGPNYYRSLSGAQGNEEVNAASQIATASYSVSDARFDTIRDICTSGNASLRVPDWPGALVYTPKVDLQSATIDAIAAKVKATP
jgi:hypothetical protein